MASTRTRHYLAFLLCLWLAYVGTRGAPLPDDPSPKETQEKSSASQSSLPQLDNVAKANPTSSGSSNSKDGVHNKRLDTKGNEKEEPVLPVYLQLIPAFCMVFLFGLGVLIIVTIQRAEDKNQTKEEINPLEDDHFGTLWISHLKQVRKKSSIIERLKSPAVLVLGAKQKKYELYESMLEKYREDIAIKRQMFNKQFPLGSKGSSKRLRDLAMLHRTKSEGSDHVEEHKGPQWHQELQAMKEEDDSAGERTESAKTVTTPLMNITPPHDSASPAIMNYPPSSNQITIRTSMVSSSADETSSTVSYFQEDREDKDTYNPLLQLHNVSTSSESADTCPLILQGETPSFTEIANRRPLGKQRARPKSWMASISSAATRGKRAFSRPRSLLVSQQAIDEGPELMPLDFDSLLTYKFEHESDNDMAKMITAVEEQMVKEVVQSKQDLTGSEIDALAKLLDDVSKFCKDFCSTEWKNKKQYSLDVVYEQSEERPAERKLKHQHSLPASYLKRRSLSDSLRKMYDAFLQRTGSRGSQLDELPLLELSTSPQSPHDIQRSPEVENLLTVAETESKVIARSSEIDDLLHLADGAQVLSVAEHLGENERERLTSYEDDVFITDTDIEQETESPLDLFAAFQQFPKPYVKVHVEIPDQEREENPDKTHYDVDGSDRAKSGSSLEELDPTPRKRPRKSKARSCTALPREKNSFDQLVDDLFEFGSCSSEASGSGRDEAGMGKQGQGTRENSESSEEEKVQRDSVVFETVIEQNLKSLEFLPSVDSEAQLADGEASTDGPLISIKNDSILCENSVEEEATDLEKGEQVVPEEIDGVKESEHQSKDDDGLPTDHPSCQFEADIEPKPKISIVAKRRPSFITVTSRRIDSVHSEPSDQIATRDRSSPPQDEDWARTSPLSDTRTPSPS